MNTKKIIALHEILLLLSFTIVLALAQAPAVAAAPVCCQKTTSNDYCQYVDDKDCAPDALKAPTSCDQTSFCKPGTCFDKGGDGYCYANTAKANCELGFKGKYSTTPIEKTPECTPGCCIIGTQALYTTEVRCKSETAKFRDLTMDFRNDITSEQACTDVARTAEQGCCVQGPDTCSYGTKATCDAARSETTGFFKDKSCSQIASCNCAPSNPSLGGKGDVKSTMCLPDRDQVYWKDSCGNPEGIVTQNVLPVPGKGNAKQTGQCDYTKGTLCGDSDKDGINTCESLDCRSDVKKLSIDLAGFQGTSSAKTNNVVRNGESFCIYDTKEQGNIEPEKKESETVGTQSPVGSRYYRSVCVNGQEVVEPCADYRQEFCAAGTAMNTALNEPITAARCIKNEAQSCITQCNTANAYTMNEQNYKEALENDQACCTDLAKRDCSWLGNKCVPKVSPGAKFWEEENIGTCSQGSVECPVVLVCPGTSSLLGACDQSTKWGEWGASAAKIAIGAGIAVAITFASGGGTAGAYILSSLLSGGDILLKEALLSDSNGWHVVSGKECLSQDFLHAANNICRSFGDCGANVNYMGKLSTTGFINTRNLPKEFQTGALILDTPSLPEVTKEQNKAFEYKDKEKVDANPGKLENPDWGKGKTFFDFTLPEEVSFGDRLEQHGYLRTFVPFIVSSFTGGIAGAAAAGEGLRTAGFFTQAGPLGKLISLIGTLNKDVETSVNQAQDKIRKTVAGKEAAEKAVVAGVGSGITKSPIRTRKEITDQLAELSSGVRSGKITPAESDKIGLELTNELASLSSVWTRDEITNAMVELRSKVNSGEIGRKEGEKILAELTKKLAELPSGKAVLEITGKLTLSNGVRDPATGELHIVYSEETLSRSLGRQPLNYFGRTVREPLQPIDPSPVFSDSPLVAAGKKAGLTTDSAWTNELAKAANPIAKPAPEKLAEQTATEVSGESAYIANAFSTAAWVDLIYETIDIVGEQQHVEKVKSTCAVWQPPKVENKEQCEQCNPDFKSYVDAKGNPTNVRALLSCTEYQCRSLGATCELINQGTGEERCVSTSKYDVTPPVIDVWKEGFDADYANKIEKLKGVNGIHIKGDIPIYQKVLIALKTDQPAQCKMSFKHGVRYADMDPYYFGTPTYKTTHRQPILWPAQANVTDGQLTFTKGGGDYTLYVRCENPKGVTTESDYVIKFSISNEPDLTAPQILTTSLGQEAYLSAGQNKTDVTLYVNEPAQCRWSLSPQSYETMSEANTCKVTNPNTFGDFTCTFKDGTTLANVGPAPTVATTKAGTNAFVYFKCQDLQKKPNKPNTMIEPYKLTLHGSDPLTITSVEPSGQIYTSLAIENITLNVATANGATLDGKAVCKYTQRESFKNTLQNMDDYFLATNASTHTQPLVLPTGDQTFYVGCVDVAGNTAYASTTFNILADLYPPRVIKAFKTDQPRTFTMRIDEDATCEFTTTNPAFKYGEGTKMIKDGTYHSTTDDANTYYARCSDNYQNTNDPPITITFL